MIADHSHLGPTDPAIHGSLHGGELEESRLRDRRLCRVEPSRVRRGLGLTSLQFLDGAGVARRQFPSALQFFVGSVELRFDGRDFGSGATQAIANGR